MLKKIKQDLIDFLLSLSTSLYRLFYLPIRVYMMH